MAALRVVVERKYVINNISKDLIGKGAFGSVYSAVNKNTGDNVAIKLEKNTENALLKHESQMYTLLNGASGIPNMRSYGIEGEYNYLVTDRLGKSLDTLLCSCGGSFSLETVINIGLRMIKCIKEVHDRGIIHRDVKPDNFLMGQGQMEGNLYIIDFGFSTWFNDSGGKHLPVRHDKKMMGTPMFTSIYVERGTLPSRRDDLESMGYILIYLLTGSLPSRGEFAPCGTFWDACGDIPGEFILFVSYCRSLAYDACPDYNYLRNILFNLHKLRLFHSVNNFDWCM